jgi:transposase InsO family protein
VGPTYVHETLSKHSAAVARLRRNLKHRTPRSGPVNQVQGLDLTGSVDRHGRLHMILGLIDHGSRACLALQALPDKSSLTILSVLVRTFRQFDLPRVLRVDNEACFNSRLLRIALAVLGIRLQRIQLHCPWQNGRIERLFGTLKASLDLISVDDHADLSNKLLEFRLWYNHVRPHQHLGGRTPAEAWAGKGKASGRPLWFSGWEGELTGWYFPPG